MGSDPQIPDAHEERLALEAYAYTGVTVYPKPATPGWLLGAGSAPQKAAGDDAGCQVETLADGIIVDQGPADLARLTWPKNDPCSISFVHQMAGDIDPGDLSRSG